MQLIGYGEFHSVTGGDEYLFVRFGRSDGTTFEMPIDEDQFQFLVNGVNGGNALPPPVAPVVRAPMNGAPVRQKPDDDDGPMQIADVDGDEPLEDDL